MTCIKEARTKTELEAVKRLFKEYAQSLPFKLDFQNFDLELESLPGGYAPPKGCLLLAFFNQQVAGCVALRELNSNICEMKRLYVKPEFRRLKIGKRLAEALIVKAKELNHTEMRLDTVPSMASAQKLYSALGFEEISAYCHNPITGACYRRLILG
ncbi:MAG: GNAT family N-acetyltransferase [Cyanophyceae cyanobacterium]